MNSTFYAAKTQIFFTSCPIIHPNLKDTIPRLDQSMLLYKFRCRCGSEYLGQTTRKLSKRVREHLPNWFLRGETRPNTSSAILKHLTDHGHLVNEQEDFRILHRIPHIALKSLRRRVLSIAEAIAIKITDPSLCRQKQLFTSLLLPWPFNSVDQRPTFRNNAVS